MSGILYLVATPIGNLGDFSFRGVEILKAADRVLAEDTRNTKYLLNHYDIQAKTLEPFHAHNEYKKVYFLPINYKYFYIENKFTFMSYS